MPATDALDINTLYLMVSQRTGLEPGKAMEQTRVVCQAISEVLDHDTLMLLCRALPEPLATLFEPSPESPAFHAPHTVAGPRSTLATGKPGSAHPVSESGADRAQSGSVARSDNPHDATKLSSASSVNDVSGLTGKDTLASGAPGSKRPLSESR
jgi:hypothetical protein